MPYVNMSSKYKNSRFVEYLTIHDTNEYMTTEEEDDKLYAGGLRNPEKREIIYVYLDEKA
ncbi:MAG: hypothetical protein HFJ52_01195 [Clostridia bacterium]|nr:hypothetical protein [Clostridia bacterium]